MPDTTALRARAARVLRALRGLGGKLLPGRRTGQRPTEGDGAPKRRFQPGALGLTGIALAAMCVTLVIIQSTLGSFRTGDGEQEEPQPEAVGTPPEGTARILIAGDSIVQGSSGDHTWRGRLWEHLADGGADADFVGPYDDLLDVNTGRFGDMTYADPGFDTAHAGVWGATIGDVAAGIGEHVAEYDPDYLLLMAGANDFAEGAEPEEALESLRDAVTTARVAGDGLQIVVGEVTPSWGTGRDDDVNSAAMAYNKALPDLAENLSGARPVVVAHTSEDYAPADDNWDTTHPNARGELKIAAAFADALSGPLGFGEPYPRPLPDVPLGPRTPPEVGAEEQDGEVVLSWEPVPGATGYAVFQQRTDPDPDEQVRLPTEVGGSDGERRTATVDRLLSGASYEFVVRPYKGDDAGAESEPAALVFGDDRLPAPADVRIEDGDTLVWEEAEGAGHYEVLRREMRCAGLTPPEDGDRGESDEPSGGSDEPADPDCTPVDDRGPDEGAGWESAAVVDSGTSWPLAAPAGAGYQFTVRSHRDYVQGDHSPPIEYVPDA